MFDECTTCQKLAQFIQIEGGNYYCASCILEMYGMENQ